MGVYLEDRSRRAVINSWVVSGEIAFRNIVSKNAISSSVSRKVLFSSAMLVFISSVWCRVKMSGKRAGHAWPYPDCCQWTMR